MNRKTKGIIVGVATVAAVGAGAGVAVGAGDDEVDTPITGDALGQAETAALEFTGEGQVTGTEVGDEESYYEVEVTLPNGEETDVQLDRSFDVVTSETDAQGDD